MPVINNATVASGTGLSTAGNGGRKLVRLNNGWIVVGVRTGSTLSLYVSKNQGGSFTLHNAHTASGSITDFALTAVNNNVHVFFAWGNTGVNAYLVDELGVRKSVHNTGVAESSINGVSLIANDTEVHATWASRNAFHPNSSNIRYTKGTINADGSVTWGAAEQVTFFNTQGYSANNPVLFVKDGIPIIAADSNFLLTANNVSFTDSKGVMIFKRDSTLFNNSLLGAGWTAKAIYDSRASGSNQDQSSPSGLFVPQAINGLTNGRIWVAWHGKDATDSAKFNIRVSHSDDGGVTWSTPVKLTSGNTFDRLNVSLSADKAGKVFALYEDHQWAPDLGIRMKTHNGSWGAETSVATADTAEQHPSTLVDFGLQMTTPPFVYTDTTLGIRFTGNFNVGASVSPASGALGNKESQSLTAYTVTPEAGSTVTQIVERINGTVVNTYNNPASLSRTLTAPQATWDTLAYFATHTASVTVTDSNGAQTVTTYSFDKTLSNVASLIEATKANNDAKNRISTKRDALASQVGLSAGATFDAISAQLASGVFKKFATGKISATSANEITVSGLTFKPSIVLIALDDVDSDSEMTLYWSALSETKAYFGGSSSSYVMSSLNHYVNNTGFRLRKFGANSAVTWIAIQ